MVPEEDKIVYIELGKKIKALREKKGLSLRQLSAICDTEHNKIHAIEAGTLNFRFSTIIKIANGLDIPISELINPY